MKTRVIVTGAGGSAAANFANALELCDSIELVGADIDPRRLHLSKINRNVLIPKATAPEYIDAINRVIADEGADVLHVQPDVEVLTVGRARDRIKAQMFLPDQETIEIASEKDRFAACLAATDVAVPESHALENEASIADVMNDMLTRHERLWVRARRGAGSRAALPVRTVAQAQAWISWWVDERGLAVDDFMVAEFLPGAEFAFQSIWQDGQLIVGQARERVEYLYGFLSPSGQSSTPAIARTVKRADVDATALAAIHAVSERPHGVFCVDMKEAADGTVRVTEANVGRFFTTSNFFAAAGINMPEMSIRAALGEQLSPIGVSPLAADLYWIRMVDMGYKLVTGNELNSWPSYL
ncbi:MAG: hypothetical protein ACOYN3_08105 [Acidimicrobiia bacterium]